MSWICVAKFPKPVDLKEFRSFLVSRDVEFEFKEEENDYFLWVRSEAEKAKVMELLSAYTHQAGSSYGPIFSKRSAQLFVDSIRTAPLTYLLVAISVLLYFLERSGTQNVTWTMIFAPFDYMYATGEWWRLFTPALLHGGFIHLFFNVLWIWELGIKIERYLGLASFFLIVLVAGVFSNVSQYVVSDSINFRGLSGIIYAFVGFLWLYGKFSKEKSLQLSNGIYIFMFVWLGLGVLGIIDQVLPGNISIANGAHAGGLIIGLIIAQACIKVNVASLGAVKRGKGNKK